MTGGLGGQALMREAVLSVSLTLGIWAEGQWRPAIEKQSFLMTKLSTWIGPPLDRGCFCHSNLWMYISERTNMSCVLDLINRALTDNVG